MKIIFWLNGPPVAIKGVFNAVSEIWADETYYVVTKEMSDARKMVQSTDERYGKTKLIYISASSDKLKAARAFIDLHLDDLHVFNGYKNNMNVYLDLVISENPDAKIFVWAERIGYRGDGFLRWISAIPLTANHVFYRIKYNRHIDALLPLGRAGVKAYKKLGWPTGKIFPFLYLPDVPENLPPVDHPVNEPVRFVYLGRFSKRWKGTHILKKACEILANMGCDFHIDFVGGYGDIKNEIISWIESVDYASFAGTWPLQQTCKNLQQYDVCVVPSTFEGWNVTVNQTINAGIGCICTDEAVSNELIEKSESGLVVRAGDPVAIANAMRQVVEKKSLIKDWRQKAFSYKKRISSKVCAGYFISIVESVYGNLHDRPTPPWY